MTTSGRPVHVLIVSVLFWMMKQRSAIVEVP